MIPIGQESWRSEFVSGWLCVTPYLYTGTSWRMFAVPPIDRYLHYVSLHTFWRSWDANHTLCVPTASMFAYYHRVIRDNVQRLGIVLRKATITEHTIMPFSCFIWVAEYSVAILFLPAFICALTDDWSPFCKWWNAPTATKQNEGKHSQAWFHTLHWRPCRRCSGCNSSFCGRWQD